MRLAILAGAVVGVALGAWAYACGGHPSASATPLPDVDGSVDAGSINLSASVLEHHKRGTRDGLYADPLMTPAHAAGMHVDPSFDGTIDGNVYGQVLYVAAKSPGQDVLVVATEANAVEALDAATGHAIWRKTLGAPVAGSTLMCGNIDPLGITGTPIIDPASGTIYLDAFIAQRHLVFALGLADGSVQPGWPVDVASQLPSTGGVTMDPSVQSQRGALTLVGGTLYVPYGGLAGDCGVYHGWVVAISLTNPQAPIAWSTPARSGGIWAPGGLATDGTSVFATTGNTSSTTSWGGGEAIIRLSGDAVFSGQPTDYFAPSNWQILDNGDVDVGGTGPMLIDVPGATPSALVVAMGKNGVVYVADRANLGGIGRGNGTIGEGLLSARVATDGIKNAAAAYATQQASYVVLRTDGSGSSCPNGTSGSLVALKIGASSPPTLTTAWCANAHGHGSPIVTTTDGHANAIVWIEGGEGDNRLHGYDGDTGQVTFAGGGNGDLMMPTHAWTTPIEAKGRIFFAADTRLYAFTGP